MTATEIAVRNGITEAEVLALAALTPAMQARIAALRADEWACMFNPIATSTDHELALSCVANDLAEAHSAAYSAARDAQLMEAARLSVGQQVEWTEPSWSQEAPDAVIRGRIVSGGRAGDGPNPDRLILTVQPDPGQAHNLPRSVDLDDLRAL